MSSSKSSVLVLSADEAKSVADALDELSESYAELNRVLSGTAYTAKRTKELGRQGKHSTLMKLHLALIAFPDPTVSNVVDSALVVAGVVQKGIRCRMLHVDDVYRAFNNTMREIRCIKAQV